MAIWLFESDEVVDCELIIEWIKIFRRRVERGEWCEMQVGRSGIVKLDGLHSEMVIRVLEEVSR